VIHGYTFCEIVIDDQEFCERGKYKSELSLLVPGTVWRGERNHALSLEGVAMELVGSDGYGATSLCPSKNEMRAKCERNARKDLGNYFTRCQYIDKVDGHKRWSNLI
jgi:hypothetical protein